MNGPSEFQIWLLCKGMRFGPLLMCVGATYLTALDIKHFQGVALVIPAICTLGCIWFSLWGMDMMEGEY